MADDTKSTNPADLINPTLQSSQGLHGKKVLVVDDERNITLVIQAILEKADFFPLIYNDSRDAMRAIASEKPDAIITDLYMPGPSGMEVLEFCKKNFPELPVVIITAFGTVEAAVSALKNGAFDFITKPFDQTELLNTVTKAVAAKREREKEVLPRDLSGLSDFPDAEFSIIGGSSRIQEIYRLIAKVAPSPTTVLILGESGTGKELVAYEIHKRSSRVEKPFIKINCAAVPSTLIESELFGYEKGAFTGAVSSKPGRFELAHEGTLFMDEVADMPLEMQVKLLRVLQEQEFERVGGVNTIKVDVRLIAATNKDLEQEVKAGRFREDLYYRLNVVPISLPALRDRREDIDLLTKFFIKQFVDKLNKPITGIDPEAMSALRAYFWPGNIRQLENVIERMVLMSDHLVLRLSDLPESLLRELGLVDAAQLPSEEGLQTLKEIVKRQTQSLEKDLIEKALEETAGNVTKAAEKLGLSRKGLQLKIKELGLKKPILE